MKLILLTFCLCFSIGPILCGNEFNCPSLPPLTDPAQSVHKLRPQDIKVVMAFGDSITAGTYSKWQSIFLFCALGFAAKGFNINLYKDLLEYRVTYLCIRLAFYYTCLLIGHFIFNRW